MTKNPILALAITSSVLLFVSCGGGSSTQNAADADSAAVVVEEIITPADTFSFKGYQMIADMLAGKAPVDSSFMVNITSTPGFRTHSSELTATWATYKEGVVDKIRAWSEANLPTKPDSIFYPFGGPDFNYMSSFFPNAKYALLIGIEKPGKLPFVNPSENPQKLLDALRKSVETNLRSSFFVTSHMASDLNTELQGTLPVVLMFISLQGYEVVTVNPIELNEQGDIVYSNPDQVYAHTLDKKFDKGFEVQYRLPGEKCVRKVNYLRTDLSNEGFLPSHLDKTVRDKFKGGTTLLKAASYLLHLQGFSDVRNAIFENSDIIVTGPSGIPYKAFDQNQWDITLYGFWSPPNHHFTQFPQEDLKEAYARTPGKPIDFRYDYSRGSGFFVANKKK